MNSGKKSKSFVKMGIKWAKLNKSFDDFVISLIKNPDVKISNKKWKMIDRIQKDCYKTEAKIIKIVRH